jgi:hypothetical protein
MAKRKKDNQCAAAVGTYLYAAPEWLADTMSRGSMAVRAPIQTRLRLWRLVLIVAATTCATVSSSAIAAQVDITAPPGSGSFGSRVAVLPNGNIVVTDPYYTEPGGPWHVGAVHLYSPEVALISTLTGSSANDNVGGGQVVILDNGNFVVSTPNWSVGEAKAAGAVTWIDGSAGMSGVVSADNSLVGTTANDQVGGYIGVVALGNGNYVVASPDWNNGRAKNAGAVTWGNGSTGTHGAVSADNSLVGTDEQDLVGEDQSRSGGVSALPNGNYVVTSTYWHETTQANFGAVTWGDGIAGTKGPVSRHNSLLGTTDCINDVGAPSQIVVLDNGNYVVLSRCWSHGSVPHVGAVTWVNGTQPASGSVSPGNSLVGVNADDRLGIDGLTPLRNGNFVVLSPFWNGGIGAATWVDGKAGLKGQVSAANSLTGSIVGDYVGLSATALTNGNYVIRSWHWNSSQAASVGAVTWVDGNTGYVGQVSAANSLVGTTESDVIGFGGVIALGNGNYVVASPYWSNGQISAAGAVTWADGSGPTVDAVSVGNSLFGTQPEDHVGRGAVAVGTSNYVVTSYEWSNGAMPNAGAVTWVDGKGPVSGAVSVSNSLVGISANDAVGRDEVVVLANGNYVVRSYQWNNGAATSAGAATWGDGNSGVTGVISAANSLIGVAAYDEVGIHVQSLGDGGYLVAGSYTQGGTSLGAIALADGRSGLRGTIQPWNSFIGQVGYGVDGLNTAYDSSRHRLVVGQPYRNMVSLFTVDDQIFVGNFEG